jgi:RimJ/RimL family protein N-acetyltransferase
LPSASERIEIRPIRPDDKEALADGLRRLGPESRYRRFLAPLDKLSEEQLAYLTEVDHHDHEALVAVDPLSGQGVGVARFVRSDSDPEIAEVAVAVADDWQAQGIGSALLHRLTERARDEGIHRFSGSVLEENQPMRELLAELGDVHVTDRAYGAIDVEVELPREGVGAALAELLRAAARGLMRIR